MSTTRTFVAIPSDNSLQRRAAGVVQRLRPYAPNARWVSEDGFHLTLVFLGDLSDSDVAQTCRDVEWVARANAPFALRVKGVGGFPDAVRPRAVWLGVDDDAPVLRLQSDLSEALADRIPRTENRPFKPHWTLARLGRRSSAATPHLADAIARLAAHDAGELRVDELVVYASELRPEGPDYYALATCRLGVGAG